MHGSRLRDNEVMLSIFYISHFLDRIIKALRELSRTRAKFCQLIVSFSMLISYVFALKVRLKDLKFEFCQFKLEENHR